MVKTKQKPKKSISIREQRLAKYKVLYPEFESLGKKHGFEITRMAMNRWLAYYREKARLLKKKNYLESELSEVESSLS